MQLLSGKFSTGDTILVDVETEGEPQLVFKSVEDQDKKEESSAPESIPMEAT
jgi:hypothetical protein